MKLYKVTVTDADGETLVIVSRTQSIILHALFANNIEVHLCKGMKIEIE